MATSLAQKLRTAGTLVRGTFVTLPAPGIVEIFALAGFDFVVVELEHSSLDDRDVENMARAGQARGSGVLARVSDKSTEAIIRILATGVDGVVVPMVENADEAAVAAAAFRRPPAGVRGWSTLSRAAGYYLRADQESDPLCCIQVETKSAVEDIARIVAVPGVDMILLGPGDLRSSLVGAGVPESQLDEALRVAVARVVAEFSGRDWPVLCVPASYPTLKWDRETCLRNGVRAVTLSSDVAALAGAAGQLLTAY